MASPTVESIHMNAVYRNIFSGQEKQPTHLVLANLRNTYPDHHVTRVSANTCDPLDFARAGHAEAKIIDPIDIDRTYVAPPPLYATGSGNHDSDSDDSESESHYERETQEHEKADRLSENVKFGLFSYKWSGKEYLLYRYVFKKGYRCIENYFILSPRSAGLSSDGLYSLQTDELVLTVARWQSTVHNEIYVFDQGYWSKSKALWRSVRNASWDDVILDPRTKNALIEDVKGFFESRDLYEEFSVPWKRGIILHGVPGNGKTVSIRALMRTLYDNESSLENSQPIPTLYVKSLEHQHGPQYCIISIFEKARRCAPCMLVFEDLDSLVTAKCRSYFLNEVDGLEPNNGILMVGSTNHLGQLDPAIANRPSRFDRKYHFALPRQEERVIYADYWRKKLEQNKKMEFPKEACELVAEWTSGFSFAYLKELFISALLTVARGGPSEEKDVNDNGNYVVVRGGDDPASAEGSSKDTDSRAKKDLATKKTPEVKIPEMNIPEELKNNTLIRVLRQQIEALLREMDNSKHISSQKKKTKKDQESDNDSEGEESEAEMDMKYQILRSRIATNRSSSP